MCWRSRESQCQERTRALPWYLQNSGSQKLTGVRTTMVLVRERMANLVPEPYHCLPFLSRLELQDGSVCSQPHRQDWKGILTSVGASPTPTDCGNASGQEGLARAIQPPGAGLGVGLGCPESCLAPFNELIFLKASIYKVLNSDNELSG